MTVTGSGFTGATAVNFGFTPGTGLVVAPGGTQLTVTSPPGSGTVDVTVTTPFGTSPTTAADLFTYLDVTGVNPNVGLTSGGTAVTVTGSGFTGATVVSFGPNPGTGLLVAQDGTQLTVTSPAGSGTVDVRVTTPLGTSPAVIADQFSYIQKTKEKEKEKDHKEAIKDKQGSRQGKGQGPGPREGEGQGDRQGDRCQAPSDFAEPGPADRQN